MSKKVVVGMIRRFLQGWGKARRAKPSVLESTIMRVNQVQYWFLHNRGVPMVKRPCPACAQERLYTIWSDGKYHCLQCLYGLSRQPDLETITPASLAAMKDFCASWLGYVRRVEAFEDSWSPSKSAVMRLGKLSSVRPPPVCEVGECPTCDGLRPFMRREDGDGGCIFCLMQGRIVEFEIETVQDHAAA